MCHQAGPWSGGAFFNPMAETENDALLEHLLDHPNLAPFVATRLIQVGSAHPLTSHHP